MADTLEQQLDRSLDACGMRIAGHQQAQARAYEALQAQQDVARHKDRVVAGDVCDLLRAAVAQANRRLAQRAEGWTLREVPGRFSDRQHDGAFPCYPLSFETVARGRPLDVTLVVELTPTSTVAAFTIACSSSGARMSRVPLGVREMPLEQFNPSFAGEILGRYIDRLANGGAA
jgi:hypothetical protein